MRARLAPAVLAMLALAAGLAAVTLGVVPVDAQEASPSTTAPVPTSTTFRPTTFAPPTTAPFQEQPQRPAIIPLPNSGRAPEVEGDPGSASQYAVLAFVVLGLGTIVFFVTREGRRNRDRRTSMPGSGDPAEPVQP